jgi:WD40 repeat protein
MGVVYRARDPRLGRDVAIKVLPGEVAGSPERLQRFEREARAVAALNHPNILTVFDVGMHDGAPYVVTELLEGETLRAFVSRHSPTPRQILSFAVQAARGLEAAHAKGIIHRDIKPENMFVTTDGRVKILDFGLAKLTAAQAREGGEATESDPTGAGQLLGTPGYMSPEQVRGLPLDARSDVFSFGVVLYELLSGRHPYRRETPMATLSAILEETPPDLSTTVRNVSPQVAAIVARCLEKPREERFASGHDLVVALEVAAGASSPEGAAAGIEERSPYPGLSSFTVKDAAHFFGREAEAKALWQRLQDRNLLAVIGPSGTGKTSFVRAGVIPAAPEGWSCIWVTPGNRPFAAVARALVPELSNDPETLQRLVGAETGEELTAALGVWRRRHGEALVVVDQFEELFTLNSREVQERFAALLGQLASETDVHVLISLRDDFLMRCQEQPALAAVFTELTPLGALTKEGLRRALVKPARKLGYSFEDDALVDEMVGAVEGARAALPLLAFAVSRLWEKRDRERKLLTRAAYEEIGGVAGALAQHAEAVMDRIGVGQEVVREIFRNLVTAQGTRAVVDRDELLSAFPEKRVAEGVLRELIDARLVTSYEVEGREGEANHHRVEVVHESLLKAWPRLVWWQAQDEEGAVLRDQLKQAAHLWDEKGRTEDLLWTGTAYQEFALWRGRYTGALTALEEEFARSMAGRARQRRRLVRLAVAAAFVLVTVIAIVIGISRQQAVRAREQARAEAGQREAAQLLSLGRLRLADHPNAALAYAIASLERSDNDPARRFAVEALWQGPPAFFLTNIPALPIDLQWSPDGRWLATGGPPGLTVLSRETGERRQLTSTAESTVGFTSDGRRLVTNLIVGADEVFHIWALPEGQLEHTLQHTGRATAVLIDDQILAFARDRTAERGEQRVFVGRRLSLDGDSQQVLGHWEPQGPQGWRIDPRGMWIFSLQRGRVVQQRLDALSAPGRILGTHEGEALLWAAPSNDWAVTGDSGGQVRIWNVPSARLERTLKSPADARLIGLDPGGRFLAGGPGSGNSPRSLFLFDLAAPRTAEPAPLLSSVYGYLNDLKFSPDGSWLAGIFFGEISLWNMRGARSIVLGRQEPPLTAVSFTRDGHLLSTSDKGILRRWPLSVAADEGLQTLWSRLDAGIGLSLEVDPGGRFVVLAQRQVGKALIVPLDGSKPVSHQLKAHSRSPLWASHQSLDPSGRFAAFAAYSLADPDVNSIRILDLATGDERTLDTHPKGKERCEEVGSLNEGVAIPVWLPDGSLLSDGDAGLRVWDLAAGTSRLLRPCRKSPQNFFYLLESPDSRMVLRLDAADQTGSISSLSVFVLASRATREITSHGKMLMSFALGTRGTILVTGDKNGVVRVGLINGEEPHLLFGHTGPVMSVAVSPDGRWIASGSDDGTIRLWPMPDLSKPPLHTLPHNQLLAKLCSLTNLRAVRDPSSDTGWKIEFGPFPGWAVAPDWQP